jgi:hypothetical protein
MASFQSVNTAQHKERSKEREVQLEAVSCEGKKRCTCLMIHDA